MSEFEPPEPLMVIKIETDDPSVPDSVKGNEVPIYGNSISDEDRAALPEVYTSAMEFFFRRRARIITGPTTTPEEGEAIGRLSDIIWRINH